MKTAFIMFDRMTALDLIGVYDPLTRLKSMNFMPEFTWRFLGFHLVERLAGSDARATVAKQMDYHH